MEWSQKQYARIALAEQLIELAEHSSEIEMRSSLSRIYYAVYHVAILLVGNRAHGEISSALDEVEVGLGERFGRLLDLRQGADYDAGFVIREFGSLDRFRLQFPREMERARSLYERLRYLVR